MSGKHPILKARQVIRALERLGFVRLRQRGAHYMMGGPNGGFTLVPRHGGEDIGKGLLQKIIEEAKVTETDFFDNL